MTRVFFEEVAPVEFDETLVQNIMKRRIQDVTNLSLFVSDTPGFFAADEQPIGLTTDDLIKTWFLTVWSEQREQFAIAA